MKRELDSSICRRTAIGSGMAMVVGGALTVQSGICQDDRRGSKKMSAHFFHEEMWAHLVGTDFKVVGYSEPNNADLKKVKLELVDTQVVRLRNKDLARPKNLRSETVSLLFRGPARFVIPSVSYKLYHPATGEIDFLINRTRSIRFAKENIYEAILN